MPGMDRTTIRLTETVQKGGCAAKLPAGQLRDVLARLSLQRPPALSVGTETMDDACLWDLGNGQMLIQTLDFFTPIVDDARDFGAVAAANALSDVYAMGGTPSIALSILAFPSMTLPIEILEPLLGGALEMIHEAGACLAGGHTIDDDTLKFGLSVTGFVETGRAWTNSGARVDDVLILTKPLGTGTITSALKRKEVDEQYVRAAISSMTTLNRVPDLLADIAVSAATDITGFGLAGHGMQVARASGVRLRLQMENIPLLPGARDCLERKIINRAHKTNGEYIAGEVSGPGAEIELNRWILTDPQTSGGLLLSIPEQDADSALQKLKSRFPSTARIGRVEAFEDGQPRIYVD